VLCGFLGLTTLYLGYVISGTPAAPERKSDSAPQAAAPPKTGPKGAPGSVVFEAKGYVIPEQQIQVSPKVGGMVEELNVLEGKRVEKGAILCKIETVDYQADYDRAVHALKSARHRYEEIARGYADETEQARVDLEGAEAEFKSLFLDWKRSLSLTGTKALAPSDLEKAESLSLSQERRVDRMRLAYKLQLGPRKEKIPGALADVKAAQADLDKARWRLDNCIIRAPITGTILTKKTEQWNVVNPVAFNISASICEMADLTKLEVDLTIQERDIAKIFRGQKCRVRPDSASDRTYYGQVSRLMPIADRSKGTISVRVGVEVPREEEGVYLRPEGAALVSFLRAEKEQPPQAKKK
jgi:multidrug resistance efflux pump